MSFDNNAPMKGYDVSEVQEGEEKSRNKKKGFKGVWNKLKKNLRLKSKTKLAVPNRTSSEPSDLVAEGFSSGIDTATLTDTDSIETGDEYLSAVDLAAGASTAVSPVNVSPRLPLKIPFGTYPTPCKATSSDDSQSWGSSVGSSEPFASSDEGSACASPENSGGPRNWPRWTPATSPGNSLLRSPEKQLRDLSVLGVSDDEVTGAEVGETRLNITNEEMAIGDGEEAASLVGWQIGMGEEENLQEGPVRSRSALETFPAKVLEDILGHLDLPTLRAVRETSYTLYISSHEPDVHRNFSLPGSLYPSLYEVTVSGYFGECVAYQREIHPYLRSTVLSNVTHLTLANHKSLESLVGILACLRIGQLESLSLAGSTAITDLTWWTEPVVKAIIGLKYLNVSGCRRLKNIKWIADRCLHLEVLDISECGIRFPRVVQGFLELRELYLGNSVAHFSAFEMVSDRRRLPPQIRYLDLQNSDLRGHIFSNLAVTGGDGHNNALKVVDIRVSHATKQNPLTLFEICSAEIKWCSQRGADITPLSPIAGEGVVDFGRRFLAQHTSGIKVIATDTHWEYERESKPFVDLMRTIGWLGPFVLGGKFADGELALGPRMELGRKFRAIMAGESRGDPVSIREVRKPSADERIGKWLYKKMANHLGSNSLSDLDAELSSRLGVDN